MTFNDIVGTSSTYVAINLNCSQSVACTGITMSSIQIKSDKSGQQVISKCTNAHGTNSGVVQPKSCLQSWPDNQTMYFSLGTKFFFGDYGFGTSRRAVYDISHVPKMQRKSSKEAEL